MKRSQKIGIIITLTLLGWPLKQAYTQLSNLHLFGDNTIVSGKCAKNQFKYTLANLSSSSIDISFFTVELDAAASCQPCIHEQPTDWKYSIVTSGSKSAIKWEYIGTGGTYTLAGGSFLYPFIYWSQCSPGVFGYQIVTTIGTKKGSVVGALIPVELMLFTASQVGKVVELVWKTATETENAGFEIWRSEVSPKEGFRKITEALIPGAGNASSENSYKYVDETVEFGKTYYYRLVDVDYNGNKTAHDPVMIRVEEVIPETYVLRQNFPNPFNPRTNIQFVLAEPGQVSLNIYNLKGQLVKTLVSGLYPAGSHSVVWDATDDFGLAVSSGVYVYELKVNGFVDRKKLLLSK